MEPKRPAAALTREQRAQNKNKESFARLLQTYGAAVTELTEYTAALNAALDTGHPDDVARLADAGKRRRRWLFAHHQVAKLVAMMHLAATDNLNQIRAEDTAAAAAQALNPGV